MGARTITQPSEGSPLASSVVRTQLQLLENEIVAIGKQYDVSGTCDGTNVTFTIPVAVNADFLLWFERQSQFLTDDYTYVVGVGVTTITYVAGHQPFSGATLHKAYVTS